MTSLQRSMDRRQLERFFFGGFRDVPGECGLLLVRRPQQAAIVIFSQLRSKPHVSITNSFEDLASRVYRERLIDVPQESIRWYQHYPTGELFDEHIDHVLLDWSATGEDISVRVQDWIRLSAAEVQQLVTLIDERPA